jgi:hypothetical protein
MRTLVEDLLPSGAEHASIESALPALYDELRKVAAGYLRHGRITPCSRPHWCMNLTCD